MYKMPLPIKALIQKTISIEIRLFLTAEREQGAKCGEPVSHTVMPAGRYARGSPNLPTLPK